MSRVRHRIGHHYLKLLVIVGERYPDGLAWAVPQVRFDRTRAGLAHGEADLIEQRLGYAAPARDGSRN